MDDNLQNDELVEQNPVNEQNQAENKPNISAEEFRNRFLILREKYERKIQNKGSLEAEQIMKKAYEEVCEMAVGGDETAQCLLAYWFKHGNQALPENIELSMKWQMLSGMLGNKHTIDKLAMIFSFIYDTIIFTDEFQFFAEDYGLNESNYKYCLGPLICEYVVKSLNIDPFELSQARLTKLEFNSVTMNRFTDAANKSIDKILESMKKLNDKNI